MTKPITIKLSSCMYGKKILGWITFFFCILSIHFDFSKLEIYEFLVSIFALASSQTLFQTLTNPSI